jgi:hypothetical protein
MAVRKRSGPRLRAGEAIAGASAAALLVTMFFPWYEVRAPGQAGILNLVIFDIGRNAWQTLGVIAVFLALTIAVVLGVVLLRALGADWKPAIAPNAAVAVLGGLATLLILFRIVVPPSLDVGGLGLDVTPGFGAFVGLAAALGIAYGGYQAMREDGTSFAKVADNLAPRKPKRAAAKKS